MESAEIRAWLDSHVNLERMAGVAAVNMANESWRSGRMIGWDEKKQEMVPADTLDFNPIPEKEA